MAIKKTTRSTRRTAAAKATEAPAKPATKTAAKPAASVKTAEKPAIPEIDAAPVHPLVELEPTRNEIDAFKKSFSEEVERLSNHPFEGSTPLQQYNALCSLIMAEINDKWIAQNQINNTFEDKQVYFFSIEFLIGRLMRLYVNDLGWCKIVPAALEELGVDYEALQNMEHDPALGNGGLGRLMACFLDSTAALGFPGHGNGIRYKYGLFEQKIINNEQVEVADSWLKNDAYPFEIRKHDKSVIVKFGGTVVPTWVDGKMVYIQKDYEPILAVPYDVPIPGYHNDTVNSLRLWSAEPVEEFDLETFNRGQFEQAVKHKSDAEMISQILYPSDAGFEGRQLRLKQEYFFTCAGIKRIIRRYKKQNNHSVEGLDDKVIIHINDTHPALAVAELMRVLVDEEGMEWDDAWDMTIKTLTFTNHTVLPEALEKWPIDLMKTLLPRIYQIIEEINRRFVLDLNTRFPNEEARNYRISVLQDGQVHMANLAIIGSHSVNGVAELHSHILRTETFKDFYDVFPEKFTNVTNGVTQRRFMFSANPELTDLIGAKLGHDWRIPGRMTELKKLEAYADDAAFLDALANVKMDNKKRLAAYIEKTQHIKINPDSIFDIQVKRIHEYKRQLLNALHILYLYNTIKDNPQADFVPRTFILAGKAAPSYVYAKEVIKLINTIASKINNDPDVGDKLKVVFVPNFNVSSAEIIYPAAEISEQISTAGKEASGTGNMKFMMNGAVTLGTMDGANVEIRDFVGDDNIITFGLSADEVFNLNTNGGYHSYDVYGNDPRVRRVLEQLIDGSLGSHFQMIYDSLLLHNDPYYVLADFDSYAKAHERAAELYQDRKGWNRKSLMNIANSGVFSSDRSIEDYKKNVWKITDK